MNALLTQVLMNAVIATVMFGIIAACKSRIRNPALLHLLWMLVLAKLLTPPLWSPKLTWLPAVKSVAVVSVETTASPHVNSIVLGPKLTDSIESQSTSAFRLEVDLGTLGQSHVSNRVVRSAEIRRAKAFSVSPMLLIMAIWGTGSILFWGLSLWRIFHFQRCLRFALQASLEVQQTTALLGRQLGLRRCPQVWLVPGRVSPMLWGFSGPARIIVPSELFGDFDESSRQTLLLHELVHYRRGDHWVRWLEFLSLGFYWWNPIAWLLRREIRSAEEFACDAWVAMQRPDDRRTYAEMLVTTVGFLSMTDSPSLATAVGTRSNLEARLRILMRTAIDARVSGRMKAVVCLLAVLLLPLSPAFVRAQLGGEKPSTTPEATANITVAPDGKTQAAENNAEKGEELVGTVVDEEDKPVADAVVEAFLKGRRVDRVIKSNESGQFRIPRNWRPDDSFEAFAALIIRKGDSQMGWLELRGLSLQSSKEQKESASSDSFKITLLPRTDSIRGTLVDPGGKPLHDIRVSVIGMTNSAKNSINHFAVGEGQLGTATTDREGAFVIRLPAGTNASLEPQHPDWQRRNISMAPDTNDLGQITLARAGRIQGRVSDATTGKPLADQRVFVQSQDSNRFQQGIVTYGSAVTDHDGQYVIGGISPGRFNVLFAGAGIESREQSALTANAVEGVDVSVDQPVQADFKAIPGRRLSGKVLDSESGEPLAKVHVGYYGPARPHSGAACIMVRTDSKGRFEFRVPPGISKVYVADGNRGPHPDSNRTLEVPEDKDAVDVVLQAGQLRENTEYQTTTVESTDSPKRSQTGVSSPPANPEPYKLHVKLHVPAGQKVNYVVANVVHKGKQHVSQKSLLSATGNEIPFRRNDDGRATFLLIDAAGFATARSAEFVIRERMPEIGIELVPELRVPVRGKLVDPKGQPVAGARVRLARMVYGTEQEFPWGLEYLSGDDGRFEIKHARLGDKIRLRIDKPGTGGAETEWISLDSKEPRILPDLQIGLPNKEVGGIVRTNEGFPVQNAKVMHAREPRIETATDAEGRFRMTGLPAGAVWLAIESDGFPLDVRDVRAGTLDNAIYVNRINKQDNLDYQVAVTLRPRDGKEISRATLFFTVENGELLMTMPERKGNSHSVGFASFVRRNQGKQFVLVVAADGYARSNPVIVPNQRGPKGIEIDLEPAAPVTLRGRVVDDGGQPVANAKIGLSTSLNDKAVDEPWRYFNNLEKLPLTDADGKFEITGILRNSRVAVYINKPGYSGVWSDRRLTDTPENVPWTALRLSPATGELSGKVVDSEGRPARNAIVSVHDLDQVETKTDAQGRFRLQKVPNHKCWLRVQSEDGEWAQEVTPDAKNLDIKLQTQP